MVAINYVHLHLMRRPAGVVHFCGNPFAFRVNCDRRGRARLGRSVLVGGLERTVH